MQKVLFITMKHFLSITLKVFIATVTMRFEDAFSQSSYYRYHQCGTSGNFLFIVKNTLQSCIGESKVNCDLTVHMLKHSGKDTNAIDGIISK